MRVSDKYGQLPQLPAGYIDRSESAGRSSAGLAEMRFDRAFSAAAALSARSGSLSYARPAPNAEPPRQSENGSPSARPSEDRRSSRPDDDHRVSDSENRLGEADDEGIDEEPDGDPIQAVTHELPADLPADEVSITAVETDTEKVTTSAVEAALSETIASAEERPGDRVEAIVAADRPIDPESQAATEPIVAAETADSPAVATDAPAGLTAQLSHQAETSDAEAPVSDHGSAAAEGESTPEDAAKPIAHVAEDIDRPTLDANAETADERPTGTGRRRAGTGRRTDSAPPAEQPPRSTQPVDLPGEAQSLDAMPETVRNVAAATVAYADASAAGGEAFSVTAQAGMVTTAPGSPPEAAGENATADGVAPSPADEPSDSSDSGSGRAREGLSKTDIADRARLVHRIAKAFHKIGTDGGQVRMRMHPESLGSVLLEMRVRGRSVEARVTAENEASTELLRRQLPELRRRLESRGLTVERLDVELGDDAATFGNSLGNAASGPFDQGRSRDFHGERNAADRGSRLPGDTSPNVETDAGRNARPNPVLSANAAIDLRL